MPSFLSALLLLAVVAACSEAEPSAPDPGGGAGGGGSGGAPGCPDLSTSGACSLEEAGACPEGEVCTLASGHSCGEGRCCTLPLACSPAEGTLPGGFSCAEDADCASGLCLTVGGVGVCFRPCQPTGSGSTCPEGLGCVVIGLSALQNVRSCVGSDDAGGVLPERTLCREDAECPEGSHCTIVGAERIYSTGAGHGLCTPGVRTGEAGRRCETEAPATDERLSFETGWSYLCPEGGLCMDACDRYDPDTCRCHPDDPDGFCRAARCTRSCGNDGDCPSPTVCRPLEPESGFLEPSLAFKVCLLPNYNEVDWGCLDETDCCAGGLQWSGRRCCNFTDDDVCSVPPTETTHCRVAPRAGRYTTTCQLPAGKAELGAPCSLQDDCESGLCGPDGSCVSPCLPGGDRCDHVLAGSRCCPTQAGDLCVPACRLDCDAGPGCPP